MTPSQAHLKVTARLVVDQDPDEILTLIETHARRHAPPSAEVTVTRFPGSAFPFAIRRDHPALAPAAEALQELYGKPPLMIRMGGTLPVAAIFQRELGVDTVFLGWACRATRSMLPTNGCASPTSDKRCAGMPAICWRWDADAHLGPANARPDPGWHRRVV